MNSPDISIYNQFWTTTGESADVFEVEGAQPGGAGDHYPRPILKQIFELAHRAGLRVAYWPYLGPLDFQPCPGNEQGLTPNPKVFKAYTKLKAEEARLAEEHQCEMFWLGGEWNPGYEHGPEFQKVLQAVRSNFSGAILVEFLFCDRYWANEVLTKTNPDYLGLSMLIFPMSKDYTGSPSYFQSCMHGPTTELPTRNPTRRAASYISQKETSTFRNRQTSSRRR
jgi:hypothetical protein